MTDKERCSLESMSDSMHERRAAVQRELRKGRRDFSSDQGPGAAGGGRAGTAVFRDLSAPGGRGGR